MTKKKRTPKQTVQVVAKTVADIKKVLCAVPIITGFSFFDDKAFKATGFNDLVKKLCDQNDISEKHVRKVAGFNKK